MPSRPNERVISEAGRVVSTRLIFLVTGIAMATWSALVPFAKHRLGIDDAALGLLLLCLGLGSLITMPLTGMLAQRYSLRRILLTSGLVLCVALPCLAVAPTVATMTVAILAFGGSLGCVEVAMNLQAVLVERGAERPLMSGFHGLYSLGGLLGAAAATGLFSLTIPQVGSVLILVAALLAMLAIAIPRSLISGGTEEPGPFFVMPHGIVVLIGALCFITFLGEGAMVDWSALFLTAERGLDPAHGSSGYAVFSVTMTAGRLAGDRLVRRLGPQRTLIAGGLGMSAGFLLAVTAPGAIGSLAGFALVGAGASNIVPVLFSATGRQRAMPSSLAVAAISTLGYTGILTGPAFLGFVANASSLSAALLCVAVLVLAVPAAAPVILR